MSNNLRSLLQQAAELRAAGASWNAVGRAVNRKPTTCRNWPQKHASIWKPLYRTASETRYQELGNEAESILRIMLHDDDKKMKIKSAEMLLRHRTVHEPPDQNPKYPDDGEERMTKREWSEFFLNQEMDDWRASRGLPPYRTREERLTENAAYYQYESDEYERRCRAFVASRDASKRAAQAKSVAPAASEPLHDSNGMSQSTLGLLAFVGTAALLVGTIVGKTLSQPAPQALVAERPVFLDGSGRIRDDDRVELLRPTRHLLPAVPLGTAGLPTLRTADLARGSDRPNDAMKHLLPLLALTVAAPVQGDELSVYPKTIRLTGPRDEQRLVVVGAKPQASFVSGNPKVATVDANGIVRPTGDGATAIAITANGVITTVAVKVEKSTADMPVSFNREIVPILTKFGCNSGACHGSQHGKGGFKLSLFGFDPAFDHAQIVQSAEGRRVVLSDAERSILLRKPALLMEHGGGEKFKTGSREYRTLKAWLEDGAPEPDPKDPTVTSMEIFPPARVMSKGETQQLSVTAVWSDGRREDVTGTAQFDALNEAVASINQAGLVTAKADGETHIMVRFMGQAGVSQVTLPFKKIDNYPKLLSNNYIDDLLAKKWKDQGLIPSPPSSDEEFLRRPYLDLIGTLPTPKEVEEFLKVKAGNKRSLLIDKLLERPEFVDYWALKWGDLLRINRDALQEKGMWSFHNWVRASLRDNKPVDEFVRDIITAEGSTFTDGPVNYYQVGRTADDWAETTSQVFLGVRMQCAKCHHHPFEKWSQDDYYGMSAFFSRLGTKNSPEFGLFGRETVVFIRNAGEVNHPRKRVVVKPHPLDGENMDDEFDRRKKLADWMTTKDNPFFAKNIVNRFWGYLMGRGLVEPMDDMRATNPAVNPELLDALAKDFAEHKFDLKHLLRTILNSRAYQASSTVTADNAIDTANTHFTRYTTRRLTAEQMADAIDYATGTQEKYVGLPLGTRAIQLPDSRVRSYLLDVFGRPSRTIVCECERTMQPNIAQALHLLNGDFLNKKINDPAGRVENLMKNKADRKKAIEELYLVTLSRLPKAEEVSKANSWIDSAKDGREGLQDLLWTLLNSKEFLFNH